MLLKRICSNECYSEDNLFRALSLAEFGECSSCSFTVPDMCLGQKLKNEKDYLLVLHSFISLAFNI